MVAGGLIGGARALASRGKPRAHLTEEEKMMMSAVSAPVAPPQAPVQSSGLIGGQYKSPKARGFWDEVAADPFTAFFAGRNGLDRKYEAQQAEQEAARMAPMQERMDQFTQGLPDPLWYAAQTAPEDLGKQYALGAAPQKPSAPIVASPGQRGYGDTNGDGKFDELFAVPESPDSGTSPAGRVQSTFVDSNGLLNLVMGDGSVRNTGKTARDSMMAVDVGGVPHIGSRYKGGFSPVATPDEIGASKGAIAGGEQLGKTQAESIKNMPEAISTAQRAIDSIDELLNSKGFDGAYGVNRFLPQNMISGSDAKNAAAIRSKLDGQFFVSAVTSMQVSLAPVSDADALRLVASISQLSNPDISPEEARRVGNDVKNYFRAAQKKAAEAAKRGPIQNVPEPPAQPTRTPWLAQQTQKVTGMAKAGATSPAATGLEGMTLEQLEALAAQLEGQ